MGKVSEQKVSSDEREPQCPTIRTQEVIGSVSLCVKKLRSKYALNGGLRRAAGRQFLPVSQSHHSRVLAPSSGVNWSLSRA